MNIGDRGPAPSYHDPLGDPPTRDCPDCIGYGCHQCQFTGQIIVSKQEIKDDKAEWDMDRDR